MVLQGGRKEEGRGGGRGGGCQCMRVPRLVREEGRREETPPSSSNTRTD